MARINRGKLTFETLMCMLIDNLFGINRILDGGDLLFRVSIFEEIYFANVERYGPIRLIERVRTHR